MLFAIRCLDKPDSHELRAETRPAHLDYLSTFADAVHIAGPLLDEAGRPMGSLLVLDLADRPAAERFAAEDPYTRAGLFERVEIAPFKRVLP
jgi:hypothetical protein